jgi:hypothetical protein
MKRHELIFTEKLKKNILKAEVDDFIQKVIMISCQLQINPNWLMVVMELETAGTFDPSITNPLGYTGLIQFGKARASDVKTTPDALREMDAYAQLDFVKDALMPFRTKMHRLVDVYLAVFFPVAIGKPDGYVLHTSRLSAERIASWNPLFDINRDKMIQVWEIKQKINDRLPNGFYI